MKTITRITLAAVTLALAGCSSWRAGAIVGMFCPAASTCSITVDPQAAGGAAPAKPAGQ